MLFSAIAVFSDLRCFCDALAVKEVIWPPAGRRGGVVARSVCIPLSPNVNDLRYPPLMSVIFLLFSEFCIIFHSSECPSKLYF